MKIHSMLPFLDKEEIDLLIDEVLDKKVDLKLVHVLPFADEKTIDHVVDRALHDDSVLVYVSHLLPFCNQKQLNELYDAYEDGTIQRGKSCEGEMLPFLGKEKIKEIFEKKLNKMKTEIKEKLKEAKEEIKQAKEKIKEAKDE